MKIDQKYNSHLAALLGNDWCNGMECKFVVCWWIVEVINMPNISLENGPYIVLACPNRPNHALPWQGIIFHKVRNKAAYMISASAQDLPLTVPCAVRNFLSLSCMARMLQLSLSHSGCLVPKPRHSRWRRTQLPLVLGLSSHFLWWILHV